MTRSIVLALVLVGCAEEERAPFFDATLYRNEPQREALERGLSDDAFVLCDITLDECQDMLFRRTAEAFGSDTTRPPTTIITPAEFSDELDARTRTLVGDEAVDEQRRLSAEALHMLQLLGLASDELMISEADDTGTILAAYFPSQKDVLVIDYGMDMDSPLATLTLSHEYVHALQDDLYDLGSLRATVDSTDANEGQLGLIEGEAELYAGLVVTGEAVDDEAYWRGQRRGFVRGAVESPAPFYAADLSFPYLIGNEYTTFAWLAGGNDALAAAHDAVPSSSREILAGAAAEAPTGGWVERLDDTFDASIADGFEPILGDAFGAWIVHIFLEALAYEAGGNDVRLPEESIAMALRGDAVAFYARGGERVAVWRMRFEPNVSVADAMAEIEGVASGRFALREDGGDLLVFAGEPRVARDEFAEAFTLPTSSVAALRVQLPAVPRIGVVH